MQFKIVKAWNRDSIACNGMKIKYRKTLFPLQASSKPGLSSAVVRIQDGVSGLLKIQTSLRINNAVSVCEK